MNNITLITNALEYYDANNDKYYNAFKKIKYIKFIEAENDLDHNIIIMYDENKNEKFRSKYEVIGLYNSNVNIWAWGWAIPTFRKNTTNIVRRIWNYGATLDPEILYLKTELITSRFLIDDSTQLDIHVSMASYLSKQPLVYKHYVYTQLKLDKDGFLDITNNTGNYILYYMFLLDYEKLEK
jgi:hypothetical protein